MLDLQATGITDDGLANLKGSKIETLMLTNTKISDAAVPYLRELPNLTGVNVGQTQITDAGIAALKKDRPKLNVSR